MTLPVLLPSPDRLRHFDSSVTAEHKNILDMIDSVNIIANQDSSLLMLNWDKYKTVRKAEN